MKGEEREGEERKGKGKNDWWEIKKREDGREREKEEGRDGSL